MHAGRNPAGEQEKDRKRTMTDENGGRYLKRVVALLAKAESTQYAEEAEACLAKAQELMAEHSISGAAAREAGGDDREVVSAGVPGMPPYANARLVLLGGIARANNCRVVSLDYARNSTLFGARGDVRHVQLLYAALNQHLARLLAELVTPPRENGHSYRQTFVVAFGTRIGERLQEAAARVESISDVPGAGLALVERRAAVDQLLREQHPRLRERKISVGSRRGWSDGKSRADGADLGQTRIGEQRALGSGR